MLLSLNSWPLQVPFPRAAGGMGRTGDARPYLIGRFDGRSHMTVFSGPTGPKILLRNTRSLCPTGCHRIIPYLIGRPDGRSHMRAVEDACPYDSPRVFDPPPSGKGAPSQSPSVTALPGGEPRGMVRQADLRMRNAPPYRAKTCRVRV